MARPITMFTGQWAGYTGPVSVEGKNACMDRLLGSPGALRYVRGKLFDAPSAAFDAAFPATGDS
jgi:hypothetical protein